MALGQVGVDTVKDSLNYVLAPSSSVMRNRIINGQMQISQRGTSGTSGSGVPTTTATYPSVDRWFAYGTGATVTVAQVSGATNTKNLIQLTGAASVTGAGIGQRIEAVNCYDMAGQTVTLSANIANSLLTTVTWTAYYASSSDVWTSSTQIATGSWTVSSTIANYSAQIAIPSAATTGIQIIFSVGAQTSGTFQIGNAQLEVGLNATGFEYRQYGTELALCQRYFQSYGGQSANDMVTMGGTSSTSSAVAIVQLPVSMRTNPSVGYTAVSALFVDDNSSGGASTAITTGAYGLTSAYLSITTGATLVAQRPARIYINGSSARLTWSAEL